MPPLLDYLRRLAGRKRNACSVRPIGFSRHGPDRYCPYCWLENEEQIPLIEKDNSSLKCAVCQHEYDSMPYPKL